MFDQRDIINEKTKFFLKFICISRKLKLLKNIENSQVNTCL